MPAQTFSVHNILGKSPNDPRLEDVYDIDNTGKPLGKGAFGVVRLGVRKSDGKQFAVKSIAKTKLVCKEDVQDVRSEVAIMNLVAGHTNVVTLMTTHEDRDFVHIVMEVCQGGELFDSIVAAGNFTERKAAAVFRKMVDVIHHCHELGVMHRDLKPENFLLTNKSTDAELKLTDFGLGSFFKPGQRFRDLVGSPYYVAPEVLSKNYSHEADLWSLGVILYILLSGLPPFWGDTEEQIFKMVKKGAIDFKSEPWPKISPAAKDLVALLLQQDTSARASTGAILRHEWLIKEGMAPDAPLDSVVLKRMRQFAQMNKLKKAALMVVGQNLSEDELQGLRELFKTIDVDGSGTITVEEMRTSLRKWDHKINEEELKKLMDIADVDGDGTINYEEFVGATMHLSKLEKEELLQKAFRQIDTDDSGTISVSELGEALKRFGIYDSAADMLASADKNGDGMIDYAEFAYMLREQQANDNHLRTTSRRKVYNMM